MGSTVRYLHAAINTIERGLKSVSFWTLRTLTNRPASGKETGFQ